VEAGFPSGRAANLERVQEKWKPVFRPDARQIKNPWRVSALAGRRLNRHCPGEQDTRRPEAAMTQTSNRFFDEVARLMNDAAGVAGGVRRELDTLLKTQAERVLRELDVVQREDFEAVKEMAQLAREENEALKARIAALEAKLGGGTGS
jgi:BMFP domain-containing protein YqiC